MSDNPTGIGDDQLPEDLVPGDDNPLAEGLPAGETVGELLEDGKPAEQDSSEEPHESDSGEG